MRIFRHWCGAIAIGALAIALAGHNRANAQVLYGSLVGNVTDTGGGLVPGVSMSATDQRTGLERSTITDAAGAYTFVNLPPGSYTLKVTKPGFKTYQRSDITVTANNVTRTDLTLEVGNVEQSVTVTGEAAVLQTDRAEVHTDVGAVELQNLPVPLGRNYQQVYRSLPGFSPPVNSHSIPTNPSRALEFNVNGTSDDQNNTRIDGVSSTHVQLPHVVAYIPALEAIEEVNVVTNSFDAEQGLAGGAVINLQIKSGSNQLHGSAFEYHSDNHLKAWPWQVPPGQSNKPKTVYNQFGGTLGGPIKHDKLFYFVSYEGTLDHRAVQNRYTVPTDAMKAGDFSSFLNSGITIYNPYTDATGTTLADPSARLPMAAPGDPRCNTATNPGCLNIVPKSLLNTPSGQIAQKMLSFWPAPNLSGLSRNYFVSKAFTFDRHTIDSKVNWNVTSKLTAFGRFSYLHYDDTNPPAFGDFGGDAIGGSNPGHGHGNTYSSTFGGTYTIKPTFIIDAYFGFTKQGTASEQLGLGTNIGSSTLGIPGTNGTRAFESGWPEFQFSGFSTVGVPNNFMPYYRSDPQYQYVVNFNWIHGAHNVRFGTDIYRLGLNQTQAEYVAGGFYGAQGGFNFGTNTTALCEDPPACTSGTSTNRANAFASFLLGLPDSASRTFQVPEVFRVRANQYSAYIRDRWNVSSRLSLSYGVRWEMFPYPTRTDRGLERYDPNTNNVLLCGVGSISGNCDVNISKRRFSPRIGVAYRASNTFVIRAGYGITNDPYEAIELLRNNYPIMVPFGIQTPTNFIPATTLARGLPPVPAPTIPSNGVLPLPLDVGYSGMPQDLHRGYIQSWNVMLQKELGWGFSGQAGYVATRSVRQLAIVDINASQIPFTNQNTEPLFQKFGRTAGTSFVQPVGTGRYDSLQASLDRRFRGGLMMKVNYTWGKSINLVDNSDYTPNIQSLAYMSMNRAVTGFDRTHNVEITNIWDVPLGKGRKYLNKGFATPVVSGWQVNNLVSFMTGQPFSVFGSCSAGWPGNSPTMVDIVAPANKLKGTAGYNADTGQGNYWYDPNSFAQVYDPSNPGTCAPRLGNAGFNILRGPGLINWDFGVFRDFAISERFHLQFRAEAFNFTNTPHFDIPDNSLGDANSFDPRTGRITDPGGFMTITGTTNLAREGIDERQFRLGLRISF